MEWIRRNPKAAVALSALAVLLVIVVVWGMSGSSSDEPETLGTPSASPSSLLTREPLTELPSASGSPTSVAGAIAAFPSKGMGGLGLVGNGGTDGLPAHRVVITAGSDGPLVAGWRIPTADGARSGKDMSLHTSFRHGATAYGRPDYAQLYAFVGQNSSTLWCTVTVDGRVTEHQVAHGPYGQVFCQG
jgi:hypothetical protein